MYDDELCHDIKQSSLFSQFLLYDRAHNPCESIKTLDESWDAADGGERFSSSNKQFENEENHLENGMVPGV